MVNAYSTWNCMAPIAFYTTPGCQRCDEARALLTQYTAYVPVEIHELDILDVADPDSDLALAIPVLEAPGRKRLYWPFDAAGLHRWIQEQAA